MKIFDELDLTRPPPSAVVGNHGIWLPGRAIKVPFQWGGLVTKYSRQEAGYSRDTIADEIAILRALADRQMAPPVGEIVFFRGVISTYPGAWWCDPCGAYGYELADANKLPPGKFTVAAMKKIKAITGSPGAWNDISVPGRDNVINGYLIDVRRSGQDLLGWNGKKDPLPDGREVASELRDRVHRDCQFPQGERSGSYQDFWIGGQMERGQRRVEERAALIGFAPKAGESVMEIGCQSGGFLHLAAVAGARAVGVEIDPRYVDCARALSRSCGENVCIRQMDARDPGFLPWVRALFPRGVDHLLLLSMEKHLPIFPLLDAIGARTTYVETNAVASDDGNGPEPAGPMKLWPEVEKRGGRHVGNSRDRNLRRLYQITRNP